MTTRLLLVRPAATAETRAVRFPIAHGAAAVPDDVPLERFGRVAAEALRGHLPACDVVWTSAARRSVETADLAAPDVRPERIPEVAGCAMGRWTGRGLASVQRADSEGFLAWRTAATFDGHGGEPRTALGSRAQRLLRRAASAGQRTILATAHGDLIRAALVTVLAAGDEAFWSLEVPPASVTELSLAGAGGPWRVVCTGWVPVLRGAAAAAPLGSTTASRRGSTAIAAPVGAAAASRPAGGSGSVPSSRPEPTSSRPPTDGGAG